MTASLTSDGSRFRDPPLPAPWTFLPGELGPGGLVWALWLVDVGSLLARQRFAV